MVQRKISPQTISKARLGWDVGGFAERKRKIKKKKKKKSYWAVEMQPSSYEQPSNSQQTFYSIHLALSLFMKYLQSWFCSTRVCWWSGSVNRWRATTAAPELSACPLFLCLENWEFSFAGCGWLHAFLCIFVCRKMVLSHYLRDWNEKESKEKIIAERLQYEMTDFYLTH